jgi:subtilisin-like proprotein convertase family protein
MSMKALRRGLPLLLVAILVSLVTAAQGGAATFSNPGAITIPASGSAGPAAPYPSNITVSGVTGTITDVNVTLSGFSHTFPGDVGVLLVGPTGANVVLMDGAGGGIGASNLTFTFDDGAASSLPCADATLVSGTYQPNTCFPGDVFPAPAPPNPYGSLLSGFNGTDANGAWSLFVEDFASEDTGSISGGWSLDITAGETPAQKIGDLQATVSGLELPKGLTTALNSSLQEALDALAVNDTAGACDSLKAFLNQVAAQNGKKLTSDQAQQLTDAANDIRTQLDC